jgi:hypothetical protein
VNLGGSAPEEPQTERRGNGHVADARSARIASSRSGRCAEIKESPRAPPHHLDGVRLRCAIFPSDLMVAPVQCPIDFERQASNLLRRAHFNRSRPSQFDVPHLVDTARSLGHHNYTIR